MHSGSIFFQQQDFQLAHAIQCPKMSIRQHRFNFGQPKHSMTRIKKENKELLSKENPRVGERHGDLSLKIHDKIIVVTLRCR